MPNSPNVILTSRVHGTKPKFSALVLVSAVYTYTALILDSLGIEIEILEASDHVGSRIPT